MADTFNSGAIFRVSPARFDITDFNPTKVHLDFGAISVNGLILGTLPDATASIVNPWADPVQS